MNARKDDLDDVLKPVSFFKDMKAINDEFFYDIQVDKDKSIKNFFWSNAICLGAYQDFGDCVTFDTTYKTNRFHMPLGVFVGTNHHLQSTIFVVALIGDEDTKSFKLLFDTFVRCMNNKHPTCILTGEFKKKPLQVSSSFQSMGLYWVYLVLSEKYVNQAVQPLLAQKSN